MFLFFKINSTCSKPKIIYFINHHQWPVQRFQDNSECAHPLEQGTETIQKYLYSYLARAHLVIFLLLLFFTASSSSSPHNIYLFADVTIIIGCSNPDLSKHLLNLQSQKVTLKRIRVSLDSLALFFPFITLDIDTR